MRTFKPISPFKIVLFLAIMFTALSYLSGCGGSSPSSPEIGTMADRMCDVTLGHPAPTEMHNGKISDSKCLAGWSHTFEAD